MFQKYLHERIRQKYTVGFKSYAVALTNVLSGPLRKTVFTFPVCTTMCNEADRGDVTITSIPNSRHYLTGEKAAEELSL